MTADTNRAEPEASPKKIDPNLKKKQVLVVVLLVGLLVAIVTQPENASTEEAAVAETELVTSAVSVEEDSLDEAVVAEKRLDWLTQSNSLSRFEIEAIVDRSLFADEWVEPVAPLNQVVSKTRRVQAIYGSANDHAALLGTTILRSGEALPDGGRVLLVTGDGMHVSPKPRD
jgi:hypothetical protein